MSIRLTVDRRAIERMKDEPRRWEYCTRKKDAKLIGEISRLVSLAELFRYGDGDGTVASTSWWSGGSEWIG